MTKKKLTISYEEYESMKDEIAKLKAALEDSSGQVILKTCRIEKSDNFYLDKGLIKSTYLVTTFEDIKGDLVQSFKSSNPHVKYENEIGSLKCDVEFLRNELTKQKDKYKNKGIIECLFRIGKSSKPEIKAYRD